MLLLCMISLTDKLAPENIQSVLDQYHFVKACVLIKFVDSSFLNNIITRCYINQTVLFNDQIITNIINPETTCSEGKTRQICFWNNGSETGLKLKPILKTVIKILWMNGKPEKQQHWQTAFWCSQIEIIHEAIFMDTNLQQIHFTFMSRLISIQ